MSLREATVPCINATLRKNPRLKHQLENAMTRFVKEAKKDVADWYAEVTYRRERQRGAFKGAGKKDHGKNDKETKTENEESEVGDDEEHDGDMDNHAENSESEDEIEAPDAPEETLSDADIFGGRFSSLAPSTTTSNCPSVRGDRPPVNFQANLTTMIEQAVKCGALPSVAWFIDGGVLWWWG